MNFSSILKVIFRFNIFKFPLNIFLGYLLAIHLFEIIVLPSMIHPNEVLSSFSLTERFTLIWTTNTDTMHYMAIANNGYYRESPAFFPLWPMLIRLFGGSPLAAKILASLLSFIFLLGFLRLIKILGQSKISHEIILVFLAFPASFLLTSVMSEPLFLTLAVLTFINAERGKFTTASVFAALASATRPVGIILAVYLALKIFRGGSKSFKKYWFVLLISPLGLILYSTYLYWQFGDFKLFYTSQTLGWGRDLSFGALKHLIGELTLVVSQIFGPVKPVPINFLQFAAIPFSAILAVIAFKKINRELWLVSVLMILTPLASGTYLAILREILAAFPLFIPFTNFLSTRKTFFYLYLFMAIFFQSLLLVRFFNFEWVF